MADGESSDGGEEEFIPLEEMPTLRLNDILRNLSKASTTVVSLDALIPAKEDGEVVLQTLFYKMQSTVKVLSLRFNNFSPFSIELIIDWISQNNHIEILYTMGCTGLDEKNRGRLEDAWRKNLVGHRTENMGYTFIRVTQDKMLAQDLGATS